MPRLLIDSEWVETADHQAVSDPFSGAQIGTVPLAGPELIGRAIGAADAAFSKTRLQPPHERAALLQRISRAIEARADEFVDLLIREAGKPVSLAQVEVARAVMTFQIAAEEARRPGGEVLNIDALPPGEGHFGLVRRFPIGVIAGISPFNFPLNLVAHKVAPCLATGNTMVLKPTTKTPLTALLLGEVLLDAGMPRGQINIVLCSNEDAVHLTGDQRVKMISFTGSDEVGWRIKASAERKRVLLELGGNAAAIVHADADLDAAVPLIAAGAFGYAGQSCISVQRVLVHAPIYSRFREMFCQHVVASIRTGDPRDAGVTVGPMINPDAAARAEEWVDRAIEAGATSIVRGIRRGAMLEPVILENVDSGQQIWAREAFAPVAILRSYDSFEEALRLANDSTFGLQAGVFTRDVNRVMQAFQSLEVGGVLINQVPTFRVEHMPYGGIKDSGVGREGLRYAMDEMTELKSLVIRL